MDDFDYNLKIKKFYKKKYSVRTVLKYIFFLISEASLDDRLNYSVSGTTEVRHRLSFDNFDYNIKIFIE